MKKTKGIIKSIKNNKIKPIYNDFTESDLESVINSFKESSNKFTFDDFGVVYLGNGMYKVNLGNGCLVCGKGFLNELKKEFKKQLDVEHHLKIILTNGLTKK